MSIAQGEPGLRQDARLRVRIPNHAVREEEFAVATLTTTVFYLLVGIGILVEVLRRLGLAFVEVRKAEQADHDAGRDGPVST